MNVKDVGKAMQGIEFVLFSLKNEDRLQAAEVENAHRAAQQVIAQYLKPLGAFND